MKQRYRILFWCVELYFCYTFFAAIAFCIIHPYRHDIFYLALAYGSVLMLLVLVHRRMNQLTDRSARK